MSKKTRNWIIVIFIVAFPFALFLGFLIFMEGEPLPPLATLPNPNGYEDLVKAGKMISGIVSEYDKMDSEKLRGMVSSNADALVLARGAMSNQCGVPLQFTQAYLTNHIQDLIAFRALAYALTCEGKLAEMDKRWSDTAKSDLDAIRLGNEAARGGVLIDEMISIAVASRGEMQLQTIITNLDAPACRETAAALASLDSQRQSWSDVLQQENAWSHRAFPGWRYELAKWMTRKSSATAIEKARQKFNEQEQKTRQLIFELALRAYELDKGHPPAPS